jgi:hypothetical protein
VLSTLVVEGPVGVDDVAVTLVCTVVRLVTGPPGSELDSAEDAEAADDEAAEEAEERIDESEDATDALTLVMTEDAGREESEESESDGDTIDTEVVGRSEDSDDGMDSVVNGSVTEAVILLASELPTEEMIDRGLDEAIVRGFVADADTVSTEVVEASSVDVVRRTPVAVRRSVSVICRATRLAASARR